MAEPLRPRHDRLMGRTGLALCAAALVACGPPTPVTVPVPVAASSPAASLPPEVLAFKLKRDDCDHFRGEDATDAERRKFLAAALALSCTGTDQALAGLRQRHAGDAAAIAALKDYDDKIE